MSGGLDSTLATKLIIDQGIDVIGLYLDSPFGCKEDVNAIALHLGIPLKIIQKGMEYVELVRNPKYGYGKNLNPCIDCRIYMFKIARQVMKEEGADFIITGEVLGQRPMSQRREAMDLIDRDGHVEEMILRPLSAKFFPPSPMELEGWVDREKLLNLSGRSRSEQMKWAKDLRLKGYSAPAGGCLLTDANFSTRLSRFFERKTNPSMTEVRLIRLGRHFGLSGGAHAVIGRNEAENTELWEVSKQEVREGKMIFFQADFSGPDAVLSGSKDPALFNEVGKLIARYSKKGLRSEQTLKVICGDASSQMTITLPQHPEITSTGLLPLVQQ